MDKKLKIILIGITMLCLTSLTVSAASLIKSSDVVYDNTISGLQSTTVQGAVDELYSAATDYSDHERRLQALEENKFLNAHPVGSIYVTVSENENTVTKMHNLYGGTWQAYGEGRTLVGVGTTTDSNGNVLTYNTNSTGGNSKITLTTNNLPTHNHVIPALSGITTEKTYITPISQTGYYSNGKTGTEAFALGEKTASGATWTLYVPSLTVTTTASNTTTCTNCSASEINVQNPYITVYMYKRVS